MKRTELSFLALLLSLTLLLSGCSMMKQAPTSILKAQTPADTQEGTAKTAKTARQGNAIVDDARTEPEQTTAASKAGTYADNVYRNEFFGFQITLDDAWVNDSVQELNGPLLESQGASADQSPDEIIDNMGLGNGLYMLNSGSLEKLGAIQVMVTRIGVKGIALTTADELIDQLISQFSEALPSAQVSKNSVRIGTDVFPALYVANTISEAGEDIPVHMEQVIIISEDYAAVIYLIAYYEDNLDELVQYVSLL